MSLKLRIQKGFWMMKLLNRDYGVVIRAGASCLAYGLGIITSGQHILAKNLAAQCWQNDFKRAARRGAWYLRRSWVSLDVSEDDLFDPTEGMTDHQLSALERFVTSRRNKLPSATIASDLTFIAAQRLTLNGTVEAADAFADSCNSLLRQKSPETAVIKLPRTGDFPIEKAKETLADFLALFPLETLNWFVVSGTFLGLIRESGFLAHDYDIDLGVFEDEIDIPATLAKLRKSDRFVLKKYDFHDTSRFRPKVDAKNSDIPYILKIVHVSGIHIDLFIHYHDHSVTPSCDWHGSSLHRWNNSAFVLKTYQFYEFEVQGPEDADRYLTENYGDWRTPVTDFNCTTGTPNLVLVPQPTAVAIFLVRYVKAKSTDPQMAQKLEAELVHSRFLDQNADGKTVFSAGLFASNPES